MSFHEFEKKIAGIEVREVVSVRHVQQAASPKFELRDDGPGYAPQPYITKNGKRVELAELSSEEKTEVINVLFGEIASERVQAWYDYMGDDA